MRKFLPAIFFSVFFIFFAFLAASPALAARYTIYRPSGEVQQLDVLPNPGVNNYGPYTYVDNSTGQVDCEGWSYFTSDLGACQAAGKSYSNTCCTSNGGCTGADGSSLGLWDFNYVAGCSVSYGATCSWNYTYSSTTCGATDSCLAAEPYLYAGRCNPACTGQTSCRGNEGCQVGGLYKTCCDTLNGTTDGNCNGGNFTGTCPGWSTTVICGVSAGTCAAVAPYPCTTASCGPSACAIFAPPPTPTSPPPTSTPVPPTPTPTETPGCPSMTCSYSEANSGCPTGFQIVTGTGCDGFNCGGCTYVGGCSTTACETPGPTPTLPPGPTPTPTPTLPPQPPGSCPVMHPFAQIRNVTKGESFPSSVVYKGVAYNLSSPGACATSGSYCGLAIESTAQLVDADPSDILEMRVMTANEKNRDDDSGLHSVGVWFLGDRGVHTYPTGLADDEMGTNWCTNDQPDLTTFKDAQIYCVGNVWPGGPCWDGGGALVRWAGEDKKSNPGETQKWTPGVVSTNWVVATYQVAATAVPGTTAGITAMVDPISGIDVNGGQCFWTNNGSFGLGGNPPFWDPARGGNYRYFRLNSDTFCPVTNDQRYETLPLTVNIGGRVRASISGSTSILVGSAGTWEERYEGTARSGSISITRKDRGPFSCPAGLQVTDAGDPSRRRNWCVSGTAGTSTPFSRSWTPQNISDAGDYWAVANAFKSSTGTYDGNPLNECSGSPDCTFNGGWRNCAGWSDCGPPPSPNDRIDFTVTYPPPRASISGPATANVNQSLNYEGRLEGTAQSGWMTITRDDKGTFTCPSGLVVDSTGRNWCFLAVGVSSPFSGSFTPREAGVYWVLTNAFVNQTATYVGKPGDECTGNPDCTFNGGWRDCSYGWSDCGANDNIRLTVSATCQVSGVTCGAVTTNSITLNNINFTDSGWGATGMAVQRGANVINRGAPASSFTDTGLSANTTYNYFVGCYKDLGGGGAAYTGWYPIPALSCTTPSLPPTCTMSLAPDPMALFPEQTNGRTLAPNAVPTNGTISSVSYFSSNTGAATVTTPSSTSPFQSTVTPLSRGSSTVTATASLSGPGGTGSCTDTSAVSVGGCSVSLSASSVTNPNPVTVSYTGRSPNPGTEPVRLWLERRDGQVITTPPPYDTTYSAGGVTYYQLTSGNSVNGGTVNGSVTLRDLPAGDYYVHCDIPNDPNKCTGNPWGVGAGWESCSTTDNASLTVADPAPTCTGVTLAPDPMPLFPEQLTGRTLTPTVSGIRYGSISRVEYSSDDPSVAAVSPLSSVTSPFQTTVNPLVRGSTYINASARLSGAGGTGSCTGTGTVNVGGCSVSLSAPPFLSNGSVTANYTGRSPDTVTEPVRLWLERQDGQAIIPPPPNQGVWPGAVTYYQLASGNSVNGSTVNGSVTLRDLPAGDYYVHCDIPNDPNKCTGNPWGVGAGWESCSTSDNAPLTVIGVPTCSINGPDKVYLGETGYYNASATVKGAVYPGEGDADVEIDRNSVPSVSGSVQMKYEDCGDTNSTCAIFPPPVNPNPVSWKPDPADVDKTFYFFCRGYNATPSPDVECRPLGPYSGYPVVGDCSWPVSNPDACPDSDCKTVAVLPPPPWFQTRGGDIHSNGLLKSRIPVNASPPYLSVAQDLFPGLVSAGSYDFGPLGASAVSQTPPFGWLVSSPSPPPYTYGGTKYDYAKFYGNVGSLMTGTIASGAQSRETLNGLNGYYLVDAPGDLIINDDGNSWTMGGGGNDGRQLVIFVPGNLTIKGDINIRNTERNFLAFIVKGNILIDGGVKAENLNNPNLEGVFITDGQFKTGISANQLYLKGTVVAWGGIALERTYESRSIPPDTAELFEYNIDLLMNAPPLLTPRKLIWQEVGV